MDVDINLPDCSAAFTSKPHPSSPKRLQHLHGALTHPFLGELATLRCVQILKRNDSKQFGDFFTLMDEDAQELHEFSIALFDKRSDIRPWLVDGGKRSGSGCWGEELSSGDMLYVQDLTVKPEFRKRGLGSLLLQKLLASPHVDVHGHVICWPTSTDNSDDNFDIGMLLQPTEAYIQGRREDQARVVAFYRKQNGFRRIGLTHFFAYSPDVSHPSHQLAASADPDPPSNNAPVRPFDEDELQARYPVHSAASNNKSFSVVQCIQRAYQADRRSVRQRDMHGMTPISNAASKENVYAIRALLQVDPIGAVEDLRDNENMESMTPLEALENSMRAAKEFSETLMGGWRGYSDDSLRCEYLIKKALGSPLFSETESEYIKKRKFGCSCGACMGGWLSPRMRYRLSAEAAILEDMMAMHVPNLPSKRPLSKDDTFCYSVFDYIPPIIKQKIFKTFFVGAQTVFDAIYRLLEISKDDTLLNTKTIAEAAITLDSKAFPYFLAKGGKIEYVLDALVDVSKEQSVLGDGTWDEGYDLEYCPGEIKNGESAVEFSALPKCANDLEFELIRNKFGLASNVRWGPYY
ncbi:hypothetical protein CVT26_009315 [Gymnopilus dilepis]|uniref:N-acetyltransferase domain-containing protein n=1 Tax=Gymnopilus dilepis TaxID=231916 RepID=A0A409YA42_9AGAR|nr:hypothetical protein CVT26_009315 [Gymnopilus dilepis]